MKFGKEIVLLSLFAFAALVAAGAGVDEPFRQHMWVLFFALAGFTAILLRNTEFKPAAPIDPSAYMDGPIRYGAIATMFWGVVGMLVGAVIALQLAYPDLNIQPWFNFGRLRPLHTSGVVFAF
ncbi:cytochrome-c oxidase, cbb3-type subunit I, partial [Mesorhizobium australicum]